MLSLWDVKHNWHDLHLQHSGCMANPLWGLPFSGNSCCSTGWPHRPGASDSRKSATPTPPAYYIFARTSYL